LPSAAPSKEARANEARAESSPVLAAFLKYGNLLVAAGLIAAYLPRLTRSLWVDEAGTFWMARGGPIAAAQKTWHWPGQSILYSIITSFFCFESGPFRDAALRIPALIGTAAACYFLYRFAEDAIGKGSGRAAAVLFLFLPVTIDFATQARPYSAAMAAAAASCWTLFRWMRRGERSWLAAYVLATTAVLYFHYMFALILVTHAVIFICGTIGERGNHHLKELAAGCGAILLLSMPLIPHLRLTFREAHTFKGGGHLSPGDLISILLPSAYFTGILIAGLLVYLTWRDTAGKGDPIPRSSVAILLTWWIAGPVLLFALSAATSTEAAYQRYSLYSGMAFVLILVCIGYLAFGARGSLALALLSILSTGNFLRIAAIEKPTAEELLPAMRTIAEESAGQATPPPVLARSQLVESNFNDWQAGNVPGSHLYASFVAYPMKNELVPLPYALTDSGKAHVADLIRGVLKDRQEVLFVSPNESWVSWMDEEFQHNGFSVRWVKPNKYYIGVFQRSAGSPSP
jgi:hypothetical protein